MFEEYHLDNGPRVILVPQGGTKSVTTLVMYPVGSRHESESLSGASHYIEHLMFKGTEKRKNTQILTREIDKFGAEYNAFTGKESTGYYIKVGAPYFETAVDLLSDMLFHSLFDAKEMEKEKTVIVEELRMYRDNPLMNIDSIFETLLYRGSPLGRDIGGTDKHVLGFKRPEVLEYRERHYHPKNIIVVVAGAFPENTKYILQTYFGSLHDKKNREASHFKPACFGSEKKSDRIAVEHKQTDQTQLMLGFPAFEYGRSEHAALSLMNTILGGSMSSRLFIQIRERRGLAYMVSSGTERFRDTGYMYVRAGLESKNINKAIEVVKKEISKILERGVTARELKDAKTHIRGSMSLSMEDSSAQANWYAKQALFMKSIQTPEDQLQDIEQVTLDQVKQVAKKVFKLQSMRVAIIGAVDADDVHF